MATDVSADIQLRQVVVLGANGAMGAGSAALFAGGGADVTLVARDLGKCEGALAQIQSIAKSERIADDIESMTYADGMETVLADADLIFECLAEDMELKRATFAQVDATPIWGFAKSASPKPTARSIAREAVCFTPSTTWLE